MQALKNKYKNRKEIGFYALNSYRKQNEIEEGQAIFDSLGYTFKTYFQSMEKSKNLKVNGYPTVLVLKKNKVIFIGSVEVLSALDFIYLK